MPIGYGSSEDIFSDARNAWPIQLPLVEMKPRGHSNGGRWESRAEALAGVVIAH